MLHQCREGERHQNLDFWPMEAGPWEGTLFGLALLQIIHHSRLHTGWPDPRPLSMTLQWCSPWNCPLRRSENKSGKAKMPIRKPENNTHQSWQDMPTYCSLPSEAHHKSTAGSWTGTLDNAGQRYLWPLLSIKDSTCAWARQMIQCLRNICGGQQQWSWFEVLAP